MTIYTLGDDDHSGHNGVQGEEAAPSAIAAASAAAIGHCRHSSTHRCLAMPCAAASAAAATGGDKMTLITQAAPTAWVPRPCQPVA